MKLKNICKSALELTYSALIGLVTAPIIFMILSFLPISVTDNVRLLIVTAYISGFLTAVLTVHWVTQHKKNKMETKK